MTSKELREAFHTGRAYGTCILSTSPRWPAMIAGTGVDFVFIDTEHVPIDREKLMWMCESFRAFGVPPIVRIPKPDPYWASMALDAGAQGVVVPYVESVEELQDLRSAVRFSPLKGERMGEALKDDNAINQRTQEYLANRNDVRIMIANVESVPAIDNLDALLCVPGLDGLLIGPHDLSINLGVPEQYDDPIFKEAVNTIFSKAREKNIGAGIHWSGTAEENVAWMKAGANFMIHSSDYALVADHLSADLTTLRTAMGDSHSSTKKGDTTV